MPTTLARWRDSVFAPFEAGAGLFPFVTPEIRIEQLMEDGRYVVRAEIPGVDPAKDIDVTVKDGTGREVPGTPYEIFSSDIGTSVEGLDLLNVRDSRKIAPRPASCWRS